jgi:Fe-S-cluster containining protein
MISLPPFQRDPSVVAGKIEKILAGFWERKPPTQKPCLRCGSCCGPVIISGRETAEIHKYLELAGEQAAIILASTFNAVLSGDRPPMACPFLVGGTDDDRTCSCLIYPVRPVVCVIFPHCGPCGCDNRPRTEVWKLPGPTEFKVMMAYCEEMKATGQFQAFEVFVGYLEKIGDVPAEDKEAVGRLFLRVIAEVGRTIRRSPSPSPPCGAT